MQCEKESNQTKKDTSFFWSGPKKAKPKGAPGVNTPLKYNNENKDIGSNKNKNDS